MMMVVVVVVINNECVQLSCRQRECYLHCWKLLKSSQTRVQLQRRTFHWCPLLDIHWPLNWQPHRTTVFLLKLVMPISHLNNISTCINVLEIFITHDVIIVLTLYTFSVQTFLNLRKLRCGRAKNSPTSQLLKSIKFYLAYKRRWNHWINLLNFILKF